MSSEPGPRDPLAAGLFATNRISPETTRFFLMLYAPLGCVIFLMRIFIGIQTFAAACLLRKTHLLRGFVLRIMCAVLGIVATETGVRDGSVRMMVANHISCLDHMAIDLIRPCLLPSVWDIPNVLRWLFGYADLGVREGRAELVRQAKKHVESAQLPLLSFPEGAMTNGVKSLLHFSTWPFEVSSRMQPCALRVYRPFFKVEPTILGAPWWQDTMWFLFLPVTFISVTWLPTMERNEDETVESFRDRVASAVASELAIGVSSWTSVDAVNAAKRHRQEARRAASSSSRPTRKPLDPRKMDEIAMRIKQSHPAVALLDIRRDLEKTRDMQTTVERIRTGQLQHQSSQNLCGKNNGSSPSDWRKVYEERKWTMIEDNRAKYLKRVSSGDA